MSYNRELSRLLSMRKSKIVQQASEQVDDPTDLGHRIKQVTYGTSGKVYQSRGFESPEVDFSSLRKASRTEPFFRRRANRIQNLIWKNGYVLNTESEEAKQYIQSRMELFSILTGNSFDLFMRKVSRELVMFDNALILEKRLPVKDLIKYGINVPAKGVGPNKKKGPVVAYEIIPLDTVSYKRDKYGNITSWQQKANNGETKTFQADEVILIKNDDESGDILAYPALQMVLPDARILRQLETDASLVAHRLAFPVFKYRVGDPKVEGSIPKKSQELNDIWYTLEGMLLEGALIIPGTDDFEVVLSDVKIDGLSSILEYFKKRVIVGLGLSPIHMGESDANRSVTDRLDVQLYDDVKAYQKTLSDTFTLYIFFKWLLEGGFKLGLGEIGQSKDVVTLLFQEIDTDSLIKRQNHELALWVQDGITHDELRLALGKTPITDTSKLYSDLIGSITAKHKEAVDKSSAQATGGGQNQQTNAKTRAQKTSSQDDDNLSLLELLLDIKESVIENSSLSVILELWSTFESDISNYLESNSGIMSISNMDGIKDIFSQELSDRLRIFVAQSMSHGIDRGFSEAREIDPNIAPMRMTMYNSSVNIVLKSMRYYVNKLVNDLFDRIETEIEESQSISASVETAFMVLEYRIKSIVTSHMSIAENWGVCKVAQHAGYKQVWQDSELGCTVCKTGWIDTKELELKSVPPFSTHPNCACLVHIKKL